MEENGGGPLRVGRLLGETFKGRQSRPGAPADTFEYLWL